MNSDDAAAPNPAPPEQPEPAKTEPETSSLFGALEETTPAPPEPVWASPRPIEPDTVVEEPARPVPLKAIPRRHTGAAESGFSEVPNEDVEETSKAESKRPAILESRLAQPALLTGLMAFGLMLVFFFDASQVHSGTEPFWTAFFGDRVCASRIQRTGGLSLAVVQRLGQDGLPQLVSQLFRHVGPVSWLFTTIMLLSVGGRLERLAGRGHVIAAFVFGGVAGSLSLLGLSEFFPGSYIPPATGFYGVFGLLGAQAGVWTNTLVQKYQLESGLGFLPACVAVILILAWQLGAEAFDPRSTGAFFVSLVVAYSTGRLMLSLVYSWVDAPSDDPGCFSALVSFFLIITVLAALVATLVAPLLLPKPGRGPRWGPRTGAAAADMKSYKNTKQGYSLEIPVSWSRMRKGDDYETFGESGYFQGNEELYLYCRERGSFDSPDTLVPRFLGMLARDWKIKEEAIVVQEESDFPHDLGEAYQATYSVESYGRVRIQRCFYVVTDERVFFFLFHGRDVDDKQALHEKVAASLKLIKAKADGK